MPIAMVVSHRPAHSDREIDYLAIDGAKALAQTILLYWRRRGADGVQCWIEEQDALCVVRGNLISGLPPGAPAVTGRGDHALGADRSSLRSAPAWLSYLGSSLSRLA